MTKDTASEARAKQSQTSVDGNVTFFRDSRDSYKNYVETLDTYAVIRHSVDASLYGVTRLLDIGNGGVFDYDINLIPEIFALDLFLDQIAGMTRPSNIRFITGSALDLPVPDGAFDGVVINMLLHHLVGRTVRESIDNTKRAIAEALRVLKPGGRLVLIESCVSEWFYCPECWIFPLASRLIHLVTSHPITLQYTPAAVTKWISELSENVEVTSIPKGRWVLQYGVKVPSWLTPARPIRFVAYKPAKAVDRVK